MRKRKHRRSALYRRPPHGSELRSGAASMWPFRGKPRSRLRSCGVLVVSVVVLFAAGCSKPQPWEQEDPVEAFKVYAAALEYQRLDIAWEFLTPEVRAELEARKEKLDAMSDGAVDRSAWDFLSPGHVVSSVEEYEEIRVDEDASNDERTVLVVELHDERRFEVTMLRRDGRWYVDVPLESLAAGEAPAVQGESHE